MALSNSLIITLIFIILIGGFLTLCTFSLLDLLVWFYYSKDLQNNWKRKNFRFVLQNTRYWRSWRPAHPGKLFHSMYKIWIGKLQYLFTSLAVSPIFFFFFSETCLNILNSISWKFVVNKYKLCIDVHRLFFKELCHFIWLFFVVNAYITIYFV